MPTVFVDKNSALLISNLAYFNLFFKYAEEIDKKQKENMKTFYQWFGKDKEIKIHIPESYKKG